MTERLNEKREEQAWEELGATSVSPAVARALVGVFLLTLLAVPVLQLFAEPPPVSQLAAAYPTACSLETFERELEEASVVGSAVRPPWQELAIDVLGLGNEQVYPGREGWLFHRPGVDYVTGRGFLDATVMGARVFGADPCTPVPQPDPVKAIVDFSRQLGERGIDLVVMPTPVKAVVAPGAFVAGAVGPLQNVSWPEFVEALESEAVGIFDPTGLLGPDDFLATDTHWRPAAVVRVAEALAAFLEERVPLGPGGQGGAFERSRGSATNLGDLTTMLDLSARQEQGRAERVALEPVRRAGGGSLSVGAEVLLLGDSFSNIYSDRAAFAHETVDGEPLDWGAAAGLGEQLAFELDRPVDRIVRNAGGAHATRVALAGEVLRAADAGRDRLAGVRVVVYQFAMRELARGDWRAVTLGAVRAHAVDPPRTERSGVRRISGTLRARGTLPRPGTVPYPAALVALHLDEVDGAEGSEAVVVYVWGMREHAWTDAARWPEGKRLTLDVRPWDDEDVQRRLATTSRGELEDLDLLALPAYYGEWKP